MLVTFSEIVLKSSSAIDLLFSRSRSSWSTFDCFCLISTNAVSASELFSTSWVISDSKVCFLDLLSLMILLKSSWRDKYSAVKDLDWTDAIFKILVSWSLSSRAFLYISEPLDPILFNASIILSNNNIAFSLGLRFSKLTSFSRALS